MKNFIKLSVIVGLLMPLATFAIGNLADLISAAFYYIQQGIFLVMALAVVFFIYNVFRYFIASGEPAAKKDAGLYVLYGIIGFFIMLSLWGLVYILTNTFSLNNSIPSTPFGSFKTRFSGSQSGTGGFTPPNANLGTGGVTPMNNSQGTGGQTPTYNSGGGNYDPNDTPGNYVNQTGGFTPESTNNGTGGNTPSQSDYDWNATPGNEMNNSQLIR